MDNKKIQKLRLARKKAIDALELAFDASKIMETIDDEISTKLYAASLQLADIYDEISFLYKSE